MNWLQAGFGGGLLSCGPSPSFSAIKFSIGDFQVAKIHSLHRGRSKRVIVRIVPDPLTGLYRIEWPDIGLSDLANLTRCKSAAREWAERKVVTEDRKTNAARRLKSLDNFWWASSYVAQNEMAA
jgi:hypothetical protein